MSLLRALCTVFTVLVMYTSLVLGYPSGSPNTACGHMQPNHQGAQPRNDNSPFVVEVSQLTYRPNDVITVTLKSTVPDRFFKGYLVQVRKSPSLEEPVGTFQDVPNPDPQSPVGLARSMCNNPPNSGLTQNANIPRAELASTWTAPDTLQGDLQVRVTFVENFTTFWTDVTSQVMRQQDPTTASTPQVTTPVLTTPAAVPDPVTSASTTTTTTTIPYAPVTNNNDLTSSQLTTKHGSETSGSKHTVIGTISMEGTTESTGGSQTKGNSGLVVYPSTPVFTGLVCFSLLLLSH